MAEDDEEQWDRLLIERVEEIDKDLWSFKEWEYLAIAEINERNCLIDEAIKDRDTLSLENCDDILLEYPYCIDPFYNGRMSVIEFIER